MAERRFFEHITAEEPSAIQRRYCCECCGYPTLGSSNDYEICEVCQWMDDHGGDGGPGPEGLPEARVNFRAHLTKYRPGSNGLKAHDSERERAAKRALMEAYDAYVAEPDVHRRATLWPEVQRLSETMP